MMPSEPGSTTGEPQAAISGHAIHVGATRVGDRLFGRCHRRTRRNGARHRAVLGLHGHPAPVGREQEQEPRQVDERHPPVPIEHEVREDRLDCEETEGEQDDRPHDLAEHRELRISGCLALGRRRRRRAAPRSRRPDVRTPKTRATPRNRTAPAPLRFSSQASSSERALASLQPLEQIDDPDDPVVEVPPRDRRQARSAVRRRRGARPRPGTASRAAAAGARAAPRRRCVAIARTSSRALRARRDDRAPRDRVEPAAARPRGRSRRRATRAA